MNESSISNTDRTSWLNKNLLVTVLVLRARERWASTSVSHICFCEAFNWNCSPNMKVKRFLLTKKLFILWNTEMNLWRVDLSGPYCEIRTVKGSNQNSRSLRGPVQPTTKYSVFWGKKTKTRNLTYCVSISPWNALWRDVLETRPSLNYLSIYCARKTHRFDDDSKLVCDTLSIYHVALSCFTFHYVIFQTLAKKYSKTYY